MTHVENSRVRIKFCGMTRVDDVREAVRLGVDAIGIVLTRRSVRCVHIERAQQIRAVVPPLVSLVALFMDDEAVFISAAVTALAPDMLQFHGTERAEDCVRYGRPYLKAIAMGGGLNSVTSGSEQIAQHPHAQGFLLDAHSTGGSGGRGKTFDWTLGSDIHDVASPPRPIFLAGGLSAVNVGDAIRALRPYAVDVSSGIESAPGIKDFEKMHNFVAAVRASTEY